jgi:hypothetical protein
VLAFAAWLLAKPQNAILGLAATLLIPWVPPQLTSGVILALIVVAQGPRTAVIEALIAASLMVVISLVFGVPVVSIIVLALVAWVPVLLLAVLLVTTRSLTLTTQVSVILAVVGLLGFHVVVADPVAFWEPVLVKMGELARQSGLELNTELLSAELMTVSITLAFWILPTAAMLLGYGLYKKLPGETRSYGFVRDLSFGKVIAVALAVVSMLAFAIDSTVLQGVAAVLFVAFCVQGVALVHWMHALEMLPVGVVLSMYILLPVLQVLLVTVLAVFGYMDAWFAFRRRMKKA